MVGAPEARGAVEGAPEREPEHPQTHMGDGPDDDLDSAGRLRMGLPCRRPPNCEFVGVHAPIDGSRSKPSSPSDKPPTTTSTTPYPRTHPHDTPAVRST